MVWERMLDWAVTFGGRVVGAVVVLVVGYLLARVCRRLVSKLLTRLDTAPAVVSFVSRLVYVTILVLAIVTMLARFGVETASFVVVLGAVSFAIGFALQGSLANFAAGLLILVLRPFKIGDFISAAGVMGTVQDIQLFSKILSTPDNVQVLVPNSRIYGDIITNFSVKDTRRMDLPVGISYEASIQRAMEVLQDVVAGDERALKDPAPQFLVSELGDSSVNLTVRLWAESGSFWPLKFDLTRKIKEAFDENGIEIPFPQRVVHLRPMEEEAKAAS